MEGRYTGGVINDGDQDAASKCFAFSVQPVLVRKTTAPTPLTAGNDDGQITMGVSRTSVTH